MSARSRLNNDHGRARPRHPYQLIAAGIVAAISAIATLAPVQGSSSQEPPRIESPATLTEAAKVVRAVVEAGRPAIIVRSPVTQWAALTEWTPEQLTRRLSEHALPLVDESTSPSIWWYDELRQMGNAPLQLSAARQHSRENLTAGAFFGRERAAMEPSRRTYRQLSARLTGELAALSPDAQPRRFLHVAAEPLAQRSLDSLRLEETGTVAIDDACPEDRSGACGCMLWVGEPGTTTHPHYDGVANWFVQVHGRKRVALWPPEAWEILGLHPHPHPAHRQARLDMEAGVPAHAPPNATALLSPGEALTLTLTPTQP